VVGLETQLTPELVAEGLAREFVSHVQNMRKEADYEVTQRIKIELAGDDEMAAAANAYADYIKSETLAVEMKVSSGSGEIELNGHKVQIVVSC
jgi:isoleucyl-tRNA synthetase